ncbi:MAG: heparinase II/III domain-containing protein [Alphaproteobacteria bacterium]
MKHIANVILILACSLACPHDARGNDLKIPREHPRLFVHRADLAELRFRCGDDRYRDDPVAKARGIDFGSQLEALNRLREAAFKIMSARPRPDDLWVPAVLHLATGELVQSDRYTEYVANALLDPQRHELGLDGAVALDHCWDALPAETRWRIVDRWADALKSFETGERPFNGFRFTRKLTALALAITLNDEQLADERPELAGKVSEVLTAARAYLEGPFLNFCRQRGAMPTAAGEGATEEASLVSAVEIWRTGTGRSLWPELADSLGRSMEHYFYADTETVELNHGFIHDFGTRIPLRPASTFQGFIPATTWAIARNTNDPIATWYAHRSLLPGARDTPTEQSRYLWVRLIYGPLDQPEAARRACPHARHFGGGWVAMRSGWDPGDTVILFDAGQPHWRSRQHFDAGQFQIYRKGRLAIDSGDDVTFEAVPARDGETTIGETRGDWDKYYRATIAHNCVTVEDRRLRQSLYGEPWPAMGNQRLIGYDYDLSKGDVTQTPRATGRLTAFETNSFYSYAASDLTPAYLPEIVRSIERRLLFLHDGALIVLDRVRAARPHSLKTWHLQLPVRPRLIGKGETVPSEWRELSDARQVHGDDDTAGIWALPDDSQWISITNGRGRLFVRTLLPINAKRRAMGGPAKQRTIQAGPSTGASYVGGDGGGYEYRLASADFRQGLNAAYRLGRPMNLGPQFGAGEAWGRLEVAPRENADSTVFLHMLVPADADVAGPPTVDFKQQGDLAVIDVGMARRTTRVELELTAGGAGQVTLRTRDGDIIYKKRLTDTVQPDAPIPGGGAP